MKFKTNHQQISNQSSTKKLLLKKILSLVLTFFLVNIFCSAQETRKNHIYFNLGPEFRITPIYSEVEYSNIARYTVPDRQNSGMAINLGAEYFITNKLSIGFINSIRYDLVNSRYNSIPEVYGGAESADYKLLMGYHFYLAYYFKVIGKGEFFVNAGFSFLNRNSDFSNKEPVFDQNGNYFATLRTINNYDYNASKIAVGYKKGRGQVALGIYSTISAPYFEYSTNFIVPFIRGSYTFGKW